MFFQNVGKCSTHTTQKPKSVNPCGSTKIYTVTGQGSVTQDYRRCRRHAAPEGVEDMQLQKVQRTCSSVWELTGVVNNEQ
jgi:hypothetical protein